MRDERKKQARSNKAKQHSTPKAVTFPRKNELPQVGLEPTTLYTLDRALYPCMYMFLMRDEKEERKKQARLCIHVHVHVCVYTCNYCRQFLLVSALWLQRCAGPETTASECAALTGPACSKACLHIHTRCIEHSCPVQWVDSAHLSTQKACN